MDAILLVLIPSPHERQKAIFYTESEAERDTKSGETWQLPGKQLKPNAVLPSLQWAG